MSLSELDGKVKYTQLCRSLRTYGVTFFLVKVIINIRVEVLIELIRLGKNVRKE